MDAARDLERFVASLKDQSSREVGALLAQATQVRATARRGGALPDSFAGLENDPRTLVYERRLAERVHRSQRAARLDEAAGAMVWLRTVRALGSRELRHSGRQMWLELQRGQPYAEEVLLRLSPAGGRRADSPVAAVVAELSAALRPDG
ncbi:MAG: hypothetical protein JSS29_00925 [Proteobacteria bacterium]|nr:hypothetical protein [Pseudomonadota bacterium]